MQVYVFSRNQFNELMRKDGITDSTVEQFKDTIFISILSTIPMPDSEHHIAPFKQDHPNVLTLFFDDVTDGKSVHLTGDPANPVAVVEGGQSMTPDQAAKVVNFLTIHKDKKDLAVHCAAGISRSGAVGSFANDAFGSQSYEDFKRTNPRVQENYHVLSLLRNEYEKLNEK